MKNNWHVTYETITAESAEHGEFETHGFLDSNGREIEPVIGAPTPGINMSFRDAITLFNNEREYGIAVEPDIYPIRIDQAPNWFTDYGEPNYGNGETRNISLHIPDHITPASRLRIARLIDCYGAPK